MRTEFKGLLQEHKQYLIGAGASGTHPPEGSSLKKHKRPHEPSPSREPKKKVDREHSPLLTPSSEVLEELDDLYTREEGELSEEGEEIMPPTKEVLSS